MALVNRCCVIEYFGYGTIEVVQRYSAVKVNKVRSDARYIVFGANMAETTKTADISRLCVPMSVSYNLLLSMIALSLHTIITFLLFY